MKATVLIETLPAAFEMDEILHALRSRVVGLNCGRWDYIFSYIKTCRADRSRVLPERGQVGMTVPFLRAYSQLLIRTCHRRGAFAMGGMAAQIPIKGDAAANAAALDKVRADKLREVLRRPRRHLGRASGAGAGGDGGVRRAHGRTQPARPPAGGYRRRPRAAAGAVRRHHHPRRASTTTSRWPCATSPPGWTASAACPSTT